MKFNSNAPAKNSKILSFHQPWAWLIVNGHKDIENRTWKTNYRGPLYIHAGKKFDDSDYRFLKRKFDYINFPARNQFQFGGIIGIVDLVACLEDHNSVWFEKNNFKRNYAWVLQNPRKTSFYPLRGQQGLFTIEY